MTQQPYAIKIYKASRVEGPNTHGLFVDTPNVNSSLFAGTFDDEPQEIISCTTKEEADATFDHVCNKDWGFPITVVLITTDIATDILRCWNSDRGNIPSQLAKTLIDRQ